MKTCFSIIPFGDEFKDIENIIRKSATACRMKYVRGDFSDQPGSIMGQILHEIKRAAVVVADITGSNPNVFYELGIAHQIKGPERVVIITQTVDGDKAFDIHQFRQFVYSHNAAGRSKLARQLPGLLRNASESSADQEFWNVIRGRLPRTRLLVRDLRRLVDNAGSKGLANTTIRIAAGLSSIAISHKEPCDSSLGVEYRDALVAERDALRQVLLKGARLKAVLNPPRRFTNGIIPERVDLRYLRLIGLLEGRSDIRGNPREAAADVRTIKQCQFAISPVPMPNVFIVGDQVAYEGMKRGDTHGFEMTHCEMDQKALRELIEQYDDFFATSHSEMLRTHPPDGCFLEQLKNFYHEATAHTNVSS